MVGPASFLFFCVGNNRCAGKHRELHRQRAWAMSMRLFSINSWFSPQIARRASQHFLDIWAAGSPCEWCGSADTPAMREIPRRSAISFLGKCVASKHSVRNYTLEFCWHSRLHAASLSDLADCDVNTAKLGDSLVALSVALATSCSAMATKERIELCSRIFWMISQSVFSCFLQISGKNNKLSTHLLFWNTF